VKKHTLGKQQLLESTNKTPETTKQKIRNSKIKIPENHKDRKYETPKSKFLKPQDRKYVTPKSKFLKPQDRKYVTPKSKFLKLQDRKYMTPKSKFLKPQFNNKHVTCDLSTTKFLELNRKQQSPSGRRSFTNQKFVNPRKLHFLNGKSLTQKRSRLWVSRD
jgi:hypothetical protein